MGGREGAAGSACVCACALKRTKQSNEPDALAVSSYATGPLYILQFPLRPEYRLNDTCRTQHRTNRMVSVSRSRRGDAHCYAAAVQPAERGGFLLRREILVIHHFHAECDQKPAISLRPRHTDASCLPEAKSVSSRRLLADVAGRALSHCWRQSWSVNEASEPG